MIVLVGFDVLIIVVFVDGDLVEVVVDWFAVVDGFDVLLTVVDVVGDLIEFVAVADVIFVLIVLGKLDIADGVEVAVDVVLLTNIV